MNQLEKAIARNSDKLEYKANLSLLAVAIFSCFIQTSLAYAVSDEAKAAQLNTQAEMAIKNGEFSKAASVLKSSILKAEPAGPEQLRAQYLLGFIQIQQKKWSAAIQTLEGPHASPVYRALSAFCLGLAHYNLNEVEQAAENFREALASNQKDIVLSSAYYLGMIQAGKKQIDEAISSFERVVRDPDSKQPILGYARGMLALLLRPREGDERNDRLEFLGSINTYRLVPDHGLPSSDRRFGASAQISVPVIDTDANSPPGSLSPGLGRGGIGALLEIEGWVHIIRQPDREFGAHYSMSSSYLLSQMDTSHGKIFSLWSHSLGLPYSVPIGGMDGDIKHIRITPGATLLQEDPDGIQGMPPSKVFNSYFLRSDLADADTALSNTVYELAIRHDKSDFESQFPGSSSSGPGIELGLTRTKYSSLEKARSLFFGTHLEFLFSKGKNYRQLNPEGFVGYALPTRWKELDVSGKLTLGAKYFYSSNDNRFDKFFSIDFGGKMPIAQNIFLQQTIGVTEQYSNRSIGEFNRFWSATTFGFKF